MLATVETISEIWPHPNADALDFARVLGYDCIVQRNAYVVGERIIFIQPDSLLPSDRKWAEAVYKYTHRGRVRAARLRGEWSMGLVMPEATSNLDLFSLGVPRRSPRRGRAPRHAQASRAVQESRALR